MYVYICICMYIYVYVCILMYMYVYICICMYINVYIVYDSILPACHRPGLPGGRKAQQARGCRPSPSPRPQPAKAVDPRPSGADCVLRLSPCPSPSYRAAGLRD